MSTGITHSDRGLVEQAADTCAAQTEFDGITTQVVSGAGLPSRRRSKLRLDVVGGPDAGQSVVSDRRIVHIGTQPDNTLRLKDRSVSRIHVELTNTAEGIVVRDLGSTNGTYVAGIRVSEAIVPPGQELELGQSRVVVRATNQHVADPVSERCEFGLMSGSGPVMRALFALCERVAASDETVLITGETGTGKERCARSIVAASPRANRPFLVFDCGATPPSLIESELFGHVQGAFTGAVTNHVGIFERANGGSILLDEVGELPLAVQSRLLRAVENRTVRRVGGRNDVSFDVRILAATNRRLEEEVNSGSFRADLYYRLSVVQVRVPPLRQRREDVPILVRRLLQEMGAERQLDPELLQQLQDYHWPGNVRELANYLRRMMLGDHTMPGSPGEAVERDRIGNWAATTDSDRLAPFKEAKESVVSQFEQDYLQRLLRQTHGNVSEASRVAQIDRTYIARLMAKHGLRR